MTAIALFTRDLRVHDNPVLHAAAKAGRVVPLFVLDDAILGSSFICPNRARFLAESLADLHGSLQDSGAGLVVRRGDPATCVAEVAQEVGADEVHVADDVSGLAQRRVEALREVLNDAELVVHDTVVTVATPGTVTPTGKDHFAVFTPYCRRWLQHGGRDPLAAPRTLDMPKVRLGERPEAADICAGSTSPDLAAGGENEGRRRMWAWLHSGIDDYADRHDDLPGDATSRLSPYLHFGCVSASELVYGARRHGGEGADAFVRQLAWRDFHHQVLAARPRSAQQDYRPRGDRWRSGKAADADFRAWQDGRTGIPVVDAGMRQLAREGYLHNRARLVVGSFLVKTLYIDWRRGAQHFFDLLVDGDLANNVMNWQWMAGTGNDSRPNRVLNPLRQAERFDPSGDYVRRYVTELASVTGAPVHQPWKLPAGERAGLDYPEPIVDLHEAAARFQEARDE